MKQFERVDETKLYPAFVSVIKQLLINCEKRGFVFFVIQGFRTPEQQSALYNQGRSLPGKIVTNAKALESFHNFGIAVDLCHDKDHKKENGLQPDWDMTAYRVLQEEAHKLNLTSGLDFKSFPEGPHIQMKTNLTLQQLKELYLKGGLSEVFMSL